MKFWIKKHHDFIYNEEETLEKDKRFILAICDEELLGKNIGEININKEFYGGELVDQQKVLELIKDKNIGSVNAIGNNIVELLISQGIVKREETKNIDGVLHSIIFFI